MRTKLLYAGCRPDRGRLCAGLRPFRQFASGRGWPGRPGGVLCRRLLRRRVLPERAVLPGAVLSRRRVRGEEGIVLPGRGLLPRAVLRRRQGPGEVTGLV